PLLITLLFTLLCTCGRAQTRRGVVARTNTNIAFIKGETGFIIDSIAVSTSLDTLPYGFAFTQDTLLLDISIFDPVDAVTIETFGGGHSFGEQGFWVDAPTANVYLSIEAGKGQVDSVGLSPANNWYLEKLKKISDAGQAELIKLAISTAYYESEWNLMGFRFLAAYMDLPNLTRADLNTLKLALAYQTPPPLFRHPWARALVRRGVILTSNAPGKLRKYPLITLNGKGIKLERPETDFYVLNLYRSDDPASQRDHQLIQEMLQQDSLLTSFPIISVNADNSQALWRLYVRDQKFSWPHFWSDPLDKNSLIEKLAYPRRPIYLLVNKYNKLEGYYHDLDKLFTAIRWRMKDQ
ncbi:MAG: hypothetical protein AAGA31_17100, partial [Bacteroidota bacterium]